MSSTAGSQKAGSMAPVRRYLCDNRGYAVERFWKPGKEDPIAFALGDNMSWIVGASIVAVFLAARLLP